MKFADPLAVNCPRCTAESRHNPKDLLALQATCPTCNFKLDDIGRQMGARLDETSAFATWAEVLMWVEDYLGIRSPGIPDQQALGKKPFSELTLRDLVWLVQEFAPPGPDLESTAQRLVLQAAGKVAAHQVAVSEMDLPLLQALRLPCWAEMHGLTPTTSIAGKKQARPHM